MTLAMVNFTRDDYRLRLTSAGVRTELKNYHLAILTSADEVEEHEYPRLLLAHAEAMLQAVDQNSKPQRRALTFLSSGNASRCGFVFRTYDCQRPAIF